MIEPERSRHLTLFIIIGESLKSTPGLLYCTDLLETVDSSVDWRGGQTKRGKRGKEGSGEQENVNDERSEDEGRVVIKKGRLYPSPVPPILTQKLFPPLYLLVSPVLG